MTTVTLEGDYQIALYHLALYGAAAIAEDHGFQDVRVSWRAERPLRPQLNAADLDVERLALLVKEHAETHAALGSWPREDVTMTGRPRGLMSPRLGAMGDNDQLWRELTDARHRVLDALTAQRAWLDLRALAALGEPAYWSRNAKGEYLQDDGASRWEMQPRNQGSEFVGNRLRPLASAVAMRTHRQVADGLLGSAATIRDEVGKDKLDSRTPTGLASPGPTDNAVAWCALWGISQLPLAMRIGTERRLGTAITSGHIGRNPLEWFYLPVWHEPWRPARLRTILASEKLRIAATAGLPDRWSADETDLAAANAWLAARRVHGVVRFRIDRFGSDSAPERRAMAGEPLPVVAM